MHFGKTSVKYECHTTHLHVQHVSSSGAAPCNHAGTHPSSVRSKSPQIEPRLHTRPGRSASLLSRQPFRPVISPRRPFNAGKSWSNSIASKARRMRCQRKAQGDHHGGSHGGAHAATRRSHTIPRSNMHSSMSLTPDLRASLRAGHSGCAAGLQKARWAPPRAC